VARDTWKKPWQIDIKPVGTGAAALKYLVPYLFRGPISNRSIISCGDERVTFSYKEGETGLFREISLDAMAFIRRILQHVLPKGFQKIRYYGFLAPKCHRQLHRIAALLDHRIQSVSIPTRKPFKFFCPVCGKEMILLKRTPRMRGPPLEMLLQLLPQKQVG